MVEIVQFWVKFAFAIIQFWVKVAVEIIQFWVKFATKIAVEMAQDCGASFGRVAVGMVQATLLLFFQCSQALNHNTKLT